MKYRVLGDTVVFVSELCGGRARRPGSGRRGLSPSTRSYDEGLKRKHYLGAGVPEVWLVDLDGRSIEVWRPGSEEPERVRDVATWRVGDRTLEIALGDVFRGV